MHQEGVQWTQKQTRGGTKAHTKSEKTVRVGNVRGQDAEVGHRIRVQVIGAEGVHMCLH